MLDESGTELGIGGFIVHRDPEKGIDPRGLIIGPRERTMGLCGMPETVIRFDGLKVDADFALAPPSGFKRGFADLMNAYNSQRVGAGAIAMGVAAGASWSHNCRPVKILLVPYASAIARSS